MISKNIIFSFFTILLFITNCSDPVKNSENDLFAIFLLKNDTLDYREALEIGIENLNLENESFISVDDIDYYDQITENIYLNIIPDTEMFSNRMEYFGHAGDVPFVLVIKGSRFFIGSRVGMACSHIFAGPRLDFISDTKFAIKFSFSDEDIHYKEDLKYQSVLNHFAK